MYCQYCNDMRKHNAFTTSSDNIKKDRLKKHASTVDHRVALVAKSDKEGHATSN